MVKEFLEKPISACVVKVRSNDYRDKVPPISLAEYRKNPGYFQGKPLSYVEGWYVKDKANEIFGFDGWSMHTHEVVLMGETQDAKGTFKVGYRCKVTITALGVSRDGIGFGTGYAKCPVECHEKAVKEAETDAMKRAFTSFGDQFGLSLYSGDMNKVIDESELTEDQILELKDALEQTDSVTREQFIAHFGAAENVPLIKYDNMLKRLRG